MNAPGQDLLTQLRQSRTLAAARLAEFQATERDLALSRSDSDTDDEHDPEGSTVSWDRAVQAASVDAAQRHLADVEAAITRIEDGWDGSCIGCGLPIPAERLAARPHADRCVGCASSTRR